LWPVPAAPPFFCILTRMIILSWCSATRLLVRNTHFYLDLDLTGVTEEVVTDANSLRMPSSQCLFSGCPCQVKGRTFLFYDLIIGTISYNVPFWVHSICIDPQKQISPYYPYYTPYYTYYTPFYTYCMMIHIFLYVFIGAFNTFCPTLSICIAPLFSAPASLTL
jgi:hypothetical protein